MPQELPAETDLPIHSETEQNRRGDSIISAQIGEGAQYVAVGTHITQTIGYTAEQVSLLLEKWHTVEQPRVWDGRNPYLGLNAFQETDSAFFFGRTKLVDELLSRVQRARFVCVAGPSGSGKSSLVQAGLIHALRQGRLPGSDKWRFAIMSPRSEPLTELAKALERAIHTPGAARYLLEQGTQNPYALHEQAEVLLGAVKEQRLVLYVDQFEELFTQTRNEEERAVYMALLTSAATRDDGRVTVLLSMRSDFLSQSASHPVLRALISREFQLVGAMEPEELAQAIVLPALAVGAEIEPDLVAQVIADMKGEPGALPLMQFALKDLFDVEARKPGEIVHLTRRAYLESGGIHRALVADKIQ